MKRALLATLLLSAPVAAQSPDAIAAATTVVDLQQTAQPHANSARHIAELRSGEAVALSLQAFPQYQAARAAKRSSLDAALKRVGNIQADVLSHMEAFSAPITRRATIAAYARAYSVSDLNALAAFYRSPLGQKALRLRPGIEAQVSDEVRRQVTPRYADEMRAAVPRIEAELAKIFGPQGLSRAPAR